MNWAWLTDFFTAPARVRELEQAVADNAVLLEEARREHKISQLDIMNLSSELTLSRNTVNDLAKLVNEKEFEIQSLKANQSGTDVEKDNLIRELRATLLRRQGTIDNLIKQRNEAIDITPEKLQAFLSVKYPQGTDVSKIWDDYAEVIDNSFAVKLLDPIKELSGNDFKDSILKAFPGVKFNSMLMDNRYFCPSCADIIRVIRNNWGNLKPYVPERGDCNWFAERLRVHFNNLYLLNIGIVMVGMAPFGLHAWSVIKGSDGIVVCEPQNDQITILPENIEGYVAQEIIIA